MLPLRAERRGADRGGARPSRLFPALQKEKRRGCGRSGGAPPAGKGGAKRRGEGGARLQCQVARTLAEAVVEARGGAPFQEQALGALCLWRERGGTGHTGTAYRAGQSERARPEPTGKGRSGRRLARAWPLAAAAWSGRPSPWLGMSGSIPPDSSHRTAATWPLAAAQCSAEWPVNPKVVPFPQQYSRRGSEASAAWSAGTSPLRAACRVLRGRGRGRRAVRRF